MIQLKFSLVLQMMQNLETLTNLIHFTHLSFPAINSTISAVCLIGSIKGGYNLIKREGRIQGEFSRELNKLNTKICGHHLTFLSILNSLKSSFPTPRCFLNWNRGDQNLACEPNFYLILPHHMLFNLASLEKTQQIPAIYCYGQMHQMMSSYFKLSDI